MNNILNTIASVDIISRAGGSPTVSKVRKMSKCTHGRCQKQLDQMIDAGIAKRYRRWHTSDAYTVIYRLTGIGEKIAHLAREAEIMQDTIPMFDGSPVDVK